MEWTKDTSLFSSLFMYLTISVSEWWILKTGWDKKPEVLSNGDVVILPSTLEADWMDSAIYKRRMIILLCFVALVFKDIDQVDEVKWFI